MDDDEIRTVDFNCMVWSQYAIPRAIELEHRYHYHTRYNSVEYHATWSYTLQKFDSDQCVNRKEELCSNCLEDEELRADVMDTSNLTVATVYELTEGMSVWDSMHCVLEKTGQLFVSSASLCLHGDAQL